MKAADPAPRKDNGKHARETACPDCGRVLAVGEWPWCNGDPAQHGTTNYTFRLIGRFH